MEYQPVHTGVNTVLLRLAEAVRDTGYAFVTPTPATHARVLSRDAAAWAGTMRDVFGWSRRFRPEILPPDVFARMQEADVLDRLEEGWRSRVRLSTLSGMLFLHSAYPTTQPDSVFFGPDTYRFATAIERHLRNGAPWPRRVLDLGCGAGPGAIVIATAAPRAEVIGVDINETALEFARVNAALAGVAAQFRKSDLLTSVEGAFDLIVANPPYLNDTAERAYRHGGGPLGAGLSLSILDAALGRLAPGGSLLLYTGAAIVSGQDPFRIAATERLRGAGFAWSYREIDPDVFGEELSEAAYATADRIAVVLLTATKPGEAHA